MMFSLLIPLALAPIACDRDDEAEPTEARAADPAEAHGGFKHNPIDKLCDLVSCTDEQREDILALVPPPSKREKPDAAKRDAANLALATAFRGDAFSVDAVAAYRTAKHDGAKRPRPTAEMIVGVHDILTAAQRDTLADVVEARGAGALFGKGGHHKDKDGKDKGKAGKKGDRAQRFAADLCERIDCHDDQATAITTALAAAKPSRERNADADAAFAAAFRADKLDARTVTTYLAVLEAGHEQEAAQKDAAIVAIHRVLDAEQRSVLADEIADHGLRAIMPERGHHGRGGKHHKDEAPARAPA
ncbi:MAG TPA: hypothetical protein VG755_15525 [Nannocystaceae bacterium]|nr:hypothetical protein [Nannocystaceae bacterium]